MNTRTMAKLSSGLVAVIVVLSVTMSTYQTSLAAPVLTGDASADFTMPDTVSFADPGGTGDVGLPMSAPPGTVSGWDFTTLHFDYDHVTDTMYVGIDCNGICGDADGDGDPGGTAAWLPLGGQDLPDLGSTESFSLLLDGHNDGVNFEAVVGVSANLPATDISTFGVYNFTGTPFAASLGYGTQVSGPVATVNANPSAVAPDLEFSITNFSDIPGFTITPGNSFTFQASLSAGSLEDDGVGEDFLPSQGGESVS